AVRATRAEREQTRLRIAAEESERREGRLLAIAANERADARRHAYNSDMNLVRQAFDVNNLGRVLGLLDRHRPVAGEPDPRQWEWRYYRDQARSDARFAFPRQPSRIAFVTIADNGRLMLTGDDDGHVKLWDLQGRREIGDVSPAPSAAAHHRGVAAAVFSPDASRFALAVRQWEGGNRIQVWSTAERRLLGETIVDSGGFGVRFDPVENHVAYFDADWQRRVWQPAEGVPLEAAPTRGPRGRVAPLPWPSVSPDGRFAIAMEWPNRLHLVSPSGVAPDRVLAAFDGRCAAWAFSPDGARLAISPDHRADSTDVLVLDTATGVVEGSLIGNGSWVPALAFSPDGRNLATAGADQLIRIWDVASRRQTASLRGHLLEVNALAWSPDGSTLVSGSKDGSLLVWDAKDPTERPAYRVLTGAVKQVAFLAQDDGMLTLDRIGRLHHWDSRLKEAAPPEIGEGVEAVEIDRSRNRVVLALRGGGLRVVDWATRLVVTNLVLPRGTRPGARLQAQGRRLVALNSDGQIGVWDL
ncbi:MAG: hypothetical protein JNL97_01035, partial [Verrucomicrobiales bacterium]|nr:hypothetical protein [Verrucomicrobiales bacterium]